MGWSTEKSKEFLSNISILNGQKVEKGQKEERNIFIY